MHDRTISRRFILKRIGLMGTALIFKPIKSLADAAASFPCPAVAGGKIRLVVPHAAGGGYDTYARMLAPFFSRVMGTDIVVENITGAGGIVGAKVISGGRPDGRTLGLINGSGLMAAALIVGGDVPNPYEDFTVLGRVARSKHVWLTAAKSPLKTIEDVLNAASKKAVVFSTRDVGSISFVCITLAAHILGIHHAIVPGYKGSGGNVLAVLRGEVDAMSANFESVLKQIENNEVRPILQISDTAVASHPSLTGVPLLGGPTGIAARHAAAAGKDIQKALADATALAALIGAGRLIVSAKGLDPALSTCLEKTLYQTLTSHDFQAAAKKAKRSLDLADGNSARNALNVVIQAMDGFAPIIRKAVKRIRS